MPRRNRSLYHLTSSLGPNLELQRQFQNQITNLRTYNESSPQMIITPSGGSNSGAPSMPIPPSIVSKLITQSGNELVTQLGDNLIIN
jgi:hypothetical protein